MKILIGKNDFWNTDTCAAEACLALLKNYRAAKRHGFSLSAEGHEEYRKLSEIVNIKTRDKEEKKLDKRYSRLWETQLKNMEVMFEKYLGDTETVEPSSLWEEWAVIVPHLWD